MSDAPLNPLGNTIVACYALERCYVVVLDPGVTVRDTTFNLVVAFRMGDEALITLEVKLHRWGADGDARRPQRTVLGNADIGRCCGDSPTSYSVPINAAS